MTTPREILEEHLGNIEAAMDTKSFEIANAMMEIRDLMELIWSGERFDEKKIRQQAKDIWTSVMETPYDPEY